MSIENTKSLIETFWSTIQNLQNNKEEILASQFSKLIHQCDEKNTNSIFSRWLNNKIKELERFLTSNTEKIQLNREQSITLLSLKSKIKAKKNIHSKSNSKNFREIISSWREWLSLWFTKTSNIFTKKINSALSRFSWLRWTTNKEEWEINQSQKKNNVHTHREKEDAQASAWSHIEYKIPKDRAECIHIFMPACVEAEAKWWTPAAVTMAQLVLESGNGKSRLAKLANNYFGIKYVPKFHGQREYVLANDDKPNEKFIKFESPQACMDFRTSFLNKKRYKLLFADTPPKKTPSRVWKYKKQRDQAVAHWSDPIKRRCYGLKGVWYATDPRYAEKLLGIIQDNNLVPIHYA